MIRFRMRRILTLIAPVFCAVLMGVFCGIAMTAQAASKANAVPCDIQRTSCVQKADNGMSIEFDVQPKPVTTMSVNNFIVTLSRGGKPVRTAAVSLDLSMPGMFMGRNQPALKQVRDGRYEGKGIITRCASGKKTWQADVVIDLAGTTTIAGFIFEVK
jgi:hypothetical protein